MKLVKILERMDVTWYVIRAKKKHTMAHRISCEWLEWVIFHLTPQRLFTTFPNANSYSLWISTNIYRWIQLMTDHLLESWRWWNLCTLVHGIQSHSAGNEVLVSVARKISHLVNIRRWRVKWSWIYVNQRTWMVHTRYNSIRHKEKDWR